jgi:5-(carboxyamino)imidazole ribonucleotide mutase
MRERSEQSAPRVGVIMGSKNDFAVMRSACQVLEELDIPFEARVVSAHRTPDAMYRYAEGAEDRGLLVIIAAAGGAAHLPGMVAAKTTVPVLGVPIPATALVGIDALLSMVQMPRGVPVGTLAIGTAGAENAALLAAGMLGTVDAGVRARLRRRREAAERSVLDAAVLDDYPRRTS